MELLAACEHRDATGINFCYTPKRHVTLLYNFYEVIEYLGQYIFNFTFILFYRELLILFSCTTGGGGGGGEN